MCRRPMYFRGFHKLQNKWNEDAWEGRCADIYSDALSQRVTELTELIDEDCEALENEEDSESVTWLALEFLELDMEPEIYMKFLDEAEDLSKLEVVDLYRKYRFKHLMREVLMLERTYRFLKSENLSSDDVEEVLLYSDEYYSDRGIDKWVWYDEPKKEFATKYPSKAVGTRGGKRSRAREDPWAEMSFYILIWT